MRVGSYHVTKDMADSAFRRMNHQTGLLIEPVADHYRNTPPDLSNACWGEPCAACCGWKEPRHMATRAELDDAIRGLQAAYKIIKRWPIRLLVPKRVRKYVKAAIEVLMTVRPLVR